jgi:hypothetical protein
MLFLKMASVLCQQYLEYSPLDSIAFKVLWSLKLQKHPCVFFIGVASNTNRAVFSMLRVSSLVLGLQFLISSQTIEKPTRRIGMCPSSID